MQTQKSIVLLIIAFEILTTSLLAQTFLNFQLSSSYTDNLFQNYYSTEDLISTASLSLFHQTDLKTTLYYNGSLGMFSQNPDLQHHNHQVGIGKNFTLAEPENMINFGAYARFRIDNPTYEIYDNSNYYTLASLKYYLAPTTILKLKNTAGVRKYSNYAEYSYFENISAINISKFFESRTTVQIGLEHYYKDYLEDQLIIEADSSGVILSSVTKSPKVSQALVAIKIAQNLGKLTAVQAHYQISKTLSGVNRFFEFDEIYEDEMLFDDHYSYSSDEMAISVKQFLPWQIILVISGNYSEKVYNDRAVFDLAGNAITTEDTRLDYQHGATIQLTKKFTTTKIPAMKSLDLFLNYSYRKNHSNDPYYKTTINFLMFGLETNI